MIGSFWCIQPNIGGLKKIQLHCCREINKKKQWLKKYLYILLPSIATIIIFFLYKVSFDLKSGSTLGRLLIYKVDLKILYDNIFLGVGLGQFPAKYCEYQSQILASNTQFSENFAIYSDEVIYAFNDLMHIAIERGLLSAILLVTIIALITLNILNKKRVYVFPIYHGVLSIIFSGLTSYPLLIPPIALFFWILISHCVELTNDSKQEGYTSSWKHSLTLVLIGICTFYYGVSYFISIQKWEDILLKPEKINKLPILSAQLNENPHYLCFLGDYYYNASLYQEAINTYTKASKLSTSKEIRYSLGECYKKIGLMNLAEKEYKSIERFIPHLIKPKYLLAKLYYEQGEYIKFRLKYKSIKWEEAKIPSLEIELMRQELESIDASLDSSSCLTE